MEKDVLRGIVKAFSRADKGILYYKDIIDCMYPEGTPDNYKIDPRSLGTHLRKLKISGSKRTSKGFGIVVNTELMQFVLRAREDGLD